MKIKIFILLILSCFITGSILAQVTGGVTYQIITNRNDGQGGARIMVRNQTNRDINVFVQYRVSHHTTTVTPGRRGNTSTSVSRQTSGLMATENPTLVPANDNRIIVLPMSASTRGRITTLLADSIVLIY